MTISVDPENNEPRALFSLADFNGQRVLEIGCGFVLQFLGFITFVVSGLILSPASFTGSVSMPKSLPPKLIFIFSYSEFGTSLGSHFISSSVLIPHFYEKWI